MMNVFAAADVVITPYEALGLLFLLAASHIPCDQKFVKAEEGWGVDLGVTPFCWNFVRCI
jgi:hypothetical protein